MDSNLTNSTSEYLYCGQGLADFSQSYAEIHGYVSLLVCVFGSIANTLNIIVLTRLDLRSPTNAVLTGLAVADLAVMLEYIPFVLLYNFKQGKSNSLGNAEFFLFHSNFSQVFHTISILLTIILALWRYIAIAHPQYNRVWCGMKQTLIAIASAYIVSGIICIPIYISYGINTKIVNMTTANNETELVTLYYVDESEIFSSHTFLKSINYWVYGVVIKLIPCIALTILSLRLIFALLEAKRRRQKLLSASKITHNNDSKEDEGTNLKRSKRGKSQRAIEKEKQADRTTKMLLAVLFLFLITEFPQGILGLLNATQSKNFMLQCYTKLGDILDILALINSAINFILYCAMSKLFRKTFITLFRPKVLNKWIPVSQYNGNDDLNNRDMTQITQV